MSATPQLLNLNRSATQVQTTGNKNPPNLAGVPENLLKAASPAAFNLNSIRTDRTLSDNASAACRAYEGVEGLRRLQVDQPNRSQHGGGCGWMYKASSGLNPEINRGALGTAQGPSTESLSGQWYWNLKDAEKNITTQICSNASKCSQLRLLGRFTDVCGYCKTTGAVIPITKTASGMALPRYPKDSTFMCDSADITTAYGQCPAEGFNDYAGSANRKGMPVKGDLREAFGNATLEAFGNATFDDLDSCTPPLTRDCVVLSARFAGCSDNGTLIQSLKSSTGDYDSVLKNKTPYLAYKESANPGITNALLKDGSTALTNALDDFGGLLKNVESPNKKVAAAARDLCLNAGAYDDYNFCTEMTATTVVNAQNLICLRNDWQNKGGTEKGTGFPGTAWTGRTYSSYLTYVTDLINRTKSTDKTINSNALKEFIGIESYGTAVSFDLPRDDTTRGAETVWIDLVNIFTSATPIILRCDLKLAKDGEVIPVFTDAATLARKYRVPPEHIYYTSAFEVRPNRDTPVRFYVGTDDGMMVGMNQNPFEKSGGAEWGSWAFQGPTGYMSGTGTLAGANTNQTNTLVLKWFQGGGVAWSNFAMLYGGETAWRHPEASFAARADMYLTQEPLAPWLQYEICTRPNNNDGNRLGFFEKRWNGEAGYIWGNSASKSPSFDVVSSAVSFQTDTVSRADVPGKKGVMNFNTGSWWHTRAYFAFTAFKTITLLVKPIANLPVGASVHMFSHVNFAFNSIGLNLKNSGGRYVIAFWNSKQVTEIPIEMNQWNLVVLQYVGDNGYNMGIRNVTCNIAPLETLRTDDGRRTFLKNLRNQQSSNGPFVLESAVVDRRNSGFLILGGTCPDYKDINGRQSWMMQSFTGSVAWIHGFRNFLDTDELLKAEIEQTWISRWPRGNIDGEVVKFQKSSLRV